MNRAFSFIILGIVVLASAFNSLSCATGEQTHSTSYNDKQVASAERNSNSVVASSTPDGDMEMSDHTAHAPGAAVPAHYKDALSVGSLGPILSPEQFTGKVRMAYQAAREIPVTLAQLPCYCHCDRSFGHKSLHSCFEDTHGSQCSICMDEALLAYQLQKEQRLSPAEIRQTIIERYKEN